MITFAEVLKDKGYPGFEPVRHIDAPWASDQLSLFKPEDEARFWFKGFQWPRAYPLNFVWLEDGFAWGTQAAAHNMPLPPSDGLAPRVAGIFVYGSDIPVPPWLIGNRAERIGAVLPPSRTSLKSGTNAAANSSITFAFLKRPTYRESRRRSYGNSWSMPAPSMCAPGKSTST